MESKWRKIIKLCWKRLSLKVYEEKKRNHKNMLKNFRIAEKDKNQIKTYYS